MNETIIIKLYKRNNQYTDVCIYSVIGSLYTASFYKKHELDIIHEIIPIIGSQQFKIDEIVLAS